jgi:hypothetical protein
MENLLEKFNEQINALLNECHETQTPTVCNLISSKDGREKIVELIQKKVLRERLTIGEAIVSIEMEYNINSSDK